MNAVKKAFPDIIIIRCLFHFKQTLWRYAEGAGLTTNENKESIKTLISRLSSLSFQKKSEEDEVNYDKLFQEIEKSVEKEYRTMLNYYKKKWLPKSKSGTINYSDKDDDYRANSILESDNAHIKKILPNKPTWAKFYEFLKKEEDEYVINAIENEQKGIQAVKSKRFGNPYLPNSMKNKATPLTATSTQPNGEIKTRAKKSKAPSTDLASVFEENPLSRKSESSIVIKELLLKILIKIKPTK